MAFQLLTGEPPYSHDVPACLARLVLEEPVPLRMLRLMGASAAAVDFICAAEEGPDTAAHGGRHEGPPLAGAACWGGGRLKAAAQHLSVTAA